MSDASVNAFDAHNSTSLRVTSSASTTTSLHCAAASSSSAVQQTLSSNCFGVTVPLSLGLLLRWSPRKAPNRFRAPFLSSHNHHQHQFSLGGIVQSIQAAGPDPRARLDPRQPQLAQGLCWMRLCRMVVRTAGKMPASSLATNHHDSIHFLDQHFRIAGAELFCSTKMPCAWRLWFAHVFRRPVSSR